MGSENHRRLLSLGLLVALAPCSAFAREVRIYVTDSGGDRVEAIDPVANKVVQVIGGIAGPHGIGRVAVAPPVLADLALRLRQLRTA